MSHSLDERTIHANALEGSELETFLDEQQKALLRKFPELEDRPLELASILSEVLRINMRSLLVYESDSLIPAIDIGQQIISARKAYENALALSKGARGFLISNGFEYDFDPEDPKIPSLDDIEEHPENGMGYRFINHGNGGRTLRVGEFKNLYFERGLVLKTEADSLWAFLGEPCRNRMSGAWQLSGQSFVGDVYKARLREQNRGSVGVVQMDDGRSYVGEFGQVFSFPESTFDTIHPHKVVRIPFVPNES